MAALASCAIACGNASPDGDDVAPGVRPAASASPIESGPPEHVVGLQAPAQVMPTLSPLEIITLPEIFMQAGEQRLLYAQVTFDGPDDVDLPLLAASRLACESDPGVWTFINWEGPQLHPNGVVTFLRALVTAPTSGPQRCLLEVMSGTSRVDDQSSPMTIVPGLDNTLLVSVVPDVVVVPSWGQSRIELDVGAGETVLAQHYAAPPSAAALDVALDVQVTTCVPGSKAKNWCAIDGSSNQSTIATRVATVQLDAQGASCNASYTPPLSEPPTLSTVTNAAHHARLFGGHSVDIDPSCGSANFISFGLFHVVSGNPVVVDGDTQGGSKQSAGIVVAR